MPSETIRHHGFRFFFFIILSAALNVAAFPKLELSWLAFVGFVPLLLLLWPPQPGRPFLTFFLAGLLFHLGNLYWIVHVIQHYTTLSTLLSVGVLLLLCLVLSLFWGAFGLLIGRLAVRSGFERAMLAAPFLWMILEWTRNHLTHFPWCFLGDSQYENLRLAQFTTFFGVYGLSGLIMAFNAAATISIVRRKYRYLGIVIGLILVTVLYGHYRIGQPVSGENLRVGLIQGNIPQDEKIDYSFADDVNRKHLQLTAQLIQDHDPELIFWPEAATLFPLRGGGEWTRQITGLARDSSTALVVGSDSFQGREIYNTAFLVSAAGEIKSEYSKMYLVPFGEYVPFRSIFFFAGKVVHEISDFSAGKHYSLFEVNDKKFGIHICFEVVFPQLTRNFCLRGASLLSTITNDAWFGDTAAPHQHFAMAVMRAIETRRYLVRAANTGISGIVDPYGRILHRTSLFTEAKLSGEVKWVEEQTFYTRYGDVLVYVSMLLCIAVVFQALVRKSPQPTTGAHSS